MPPTRDRTGYGPSLDTGVGSPPAKRADVFYAPPGASGADSGVGSVPSARADVLDGSGGAGHAIPPLWPRGRRR